MSDLSEYKDMVNQTFALVGKAIGIHVMVIVVEHALWDTKHKFEESNLITFSEEGVVLDRLDEIDPLLAKEITRCFIMNIMDALGRLVGKQLAGQLLDKLKVEAEEEGCR